ncbi:hypothetical protein [Loktanella sp. S4079]|uniref:hypothetical protein n=1 Tax=Loktanella sp. S4079 TaxID=579483 RepID=UPI0005FA37DC|nr:hypothetical protein [Loktanella sp. S4079]KJZ20767.1 hypothetical protein TW80_08420 [Loktanella sp. S4079]
MKLGSGLIMMFVAVSLSACGCYNPTGYCGDNIPDPDRVGGPNWMLETSATERTAYMQAECAELPDVFLQGRSQTQCVRDKTREGVREACKSRFLPIQRVDDATRQQAYQTIYECERQVLRQHGLTSPGLLA